MVKSKLILMLCAIGITLFTSPRVFASMNIQRIWGNDRYDTAIEICKNGWTDGSEYAVLASGENFPDALAGSALAAKNSSAIILTNDRAEQTTKAFISSSIPSESKINILGGTGVISTELIDDVFSLVGNTSGNLILDGLKAKQGEWIYYTNGFAPLYKCKKDGSSITKLFDFDTEITDWNLKKMFSINVVGDWVYYWGSDGIYKIRTDGSNDTKILDEPNDESYHESHISPMVVIGDTIYYALNSDKDNMCYLYKVNTDGSGKTILSKEKSICSLNIVGDWAYYTDITDINDNGAIYKVKLDGSDKAKVKGIDGYIPEIIVDNGYIYYTTTSGIYKTKTDSSETICIVNDSNVYSQFNIADNWIYYSSKDGKLYRIKTDGSGNVEIIDTKSLKLDVAKKFGVSASNIIGDCSTAVSNILGDWVYYDCSVFTTGEDILNYPYKVKIDGSENTSGF